MKQNFDKKIYTAGLFINDLLFLLWKMPKIIGAMKNKKIGKAFMEKIMNVTTAVNGCTYCSWFHAKQAIDSGISKEEVKNMMNLQFESDASDFELTALLYAQDYAENNRKPNVDTEAIFYQYYGDKTAKDIILLIRTVFFGNLYGNTWDAVLSRFKGVSAKGSNVLFELIFFLLNFWIMFPIMFLVKKDQKA